MKKETIKTILNTLAMIISAIAAAISSSACITHL